jgi:hypothetical protein
MAVSIVIFLIVIVLWLGIGAAAISRGGGIDEVWDRFRDLPLIAQGVGWLLLLPWVLAVWITQTGWPVWSKAIIEASLIAFTIVAFFPRR